MLKEWIRKKTIKRIKNSPSNSLNVLFVSMMRCGVSAVGSVLSEVHEGIYGIPIDWKYAEDPIQVLETYPKGWYGIYNVNPYLIEFYDKIIVVQRKKEILREAQLEYSYAQAFVDGHELHPAELERFHGSFDFLYPQMYGHSFKEDRFFLLHLEYFNHYTEKTLNALCKWLGFDMKTYKKHVVIIPVKPDRDWEVYSCNIKANHRVGRILPALKRMRDAK